MWWIFYSLDCTIDPNNPLLKLLSPNWIFKGRLLNLLNPSQANAIDSIAWISYPRSVDRPTFELAKSEILLTRNLLLPPPPQIIISLDLWLFLLIAEVIHNAVNSVRVASTSSGALLRNFDDNKFKLNSSFPVDFGNGLLKNLFDSSLVNSVFIIFPFDAIFPSLSNCLLRNSWQYASKRALPGPTSDPHILFLFETY